MVEWACGVGVIDKAGKKLRSQFTVRKAPEAVSCDDCIAAVQQVFGGFLRERSQVNGGRSFLRSLKIKLIGHTQN